ncbi:MAG: heme lyase CcmF/NrfE family subunit [Candidatus Eisenbacteria bacterium]|uniref:Heme lyase CcmF/NrfE family subunit n=1 Tax=Eiseniibacteriota bacterium TaxID=2212470 RepID=A0A948W263_UNCEI|nr:heme lyase CcmF/NrfE family subunit [Candidatus Eisenbacteria bacterium]MBU1950150.1 heme lyase CcmF/NrfE family subunit [Candidatus Eisenbacteria bacterium]MBU2689602.1 heme lyase CcmF/NrfE family subunit [Candidatus Eisenbacteria bacterium]
MTQLGSWALYAAFAAGSIAFLLSAAAGLRKAPALLEWARRGAAAASFFTTLSAAGLISAFIAGDYRWAYVYSHSDRDLSLFYKIGALWGGQEGSLLFWALLLGFFTVGAVIRHRRDPLDWFAPVLSTLLMILVFFLGLVLFVSNPFARIPGFVPPDGHGLNPLLQHPSMMIHPPSLYIGCVGMAVPYAMAVGALISGRLDDEWIRKSRFWALLAWIFLGAGNVIGGRWAYAELGWGGYWAWDPVENASLLPWLVGTAYLHSIMAQEQRGMLKIWNIVLAMTMFLLTILGAFITRSGVIQSVHAFARSNIGYFLLGFLVVFIIFSIVLLFVRLSKLRSDHQIENLLSREAFFLLTNVVLLLAAFAVLWGTVSPMITERLGGRSISVGPPYFNRMMTPLGLILLFMTGVGPFLPGQNTRLVDLLRGAALPVLAAGMSAMVAAVSGSSGWALTAQALCVFVLMTVLQSIFRGARDRRRGSRESAPVALLRLFAANRRRYGGRIVHFGVALVFLGFSGNAFKVEKDAFLLPGETTTLGSYTLTYLGMEKNSLGRVEQVGINLLLSRHGKDLAILFPQKNWYKKSEQQTSEVAIYSRLREDIYAVFAGSEGSKVSVRVFLNPLVSFFWIGSLVMGIGAVFAMTPFARRREESFPASQGKRGS